MIVEAPKSVQSASAQREESRGSRGVRESSHKSPAERAEVKVNAKAFGVKWREREKSRCSTLILA